MVTKLSWRKYSFILFIALLASIGIYSRNTRADLTNNKSAAKNTHLDKVKDRGYLICGVAGELPGFSFINAEGKYAGLDVDLCRAVASAIFDDPSKVEFRNLSSSDRFEALKSGEIDLLSRNTTKTLSRDTNSLEFTPTIFYDSQGIMVNRNSGIKNLADLEGKSICVSENTTSYDNLKDYMDSNDITYKTVSKESPDSLFEFYERNGCTAITGDSSYLITRKVMLANPQEHQILIDAIAQEPLAPAVLEQDSQWSDVVKWITFALIQAEELNISSVNLSSQKASKDSQVRRFLGIDRDLGSEMGLSKDFTRRIIKHVGNYQEIYDRNLGEPFGFKRGPNALWQDGGLMYSPPFD